MTSSKLQHGLSETHIRTYQRVDSAVFKSTHAEWGGFSNMAAGFPIQVSEIEFKTSEALYQSCRYPHIPDAQEKIISQGSPMTAKMVGKPYRSETRPNWGFLRVMFMRWCIHQKLLHNWDSFGELLIESDGLDIVEESNKDFFWGAKPIEHDQLMGFNVLGRLLMELRQNLIDCPENLMLIRPPAVDHFVFLGKEVNPVKLQDGNVLEYCKGEWRELRESLSQETTSTTESPTPLFA